jgi:hypothetical protein
MTKRKMTHKGRKLYLSTQGIVHKVKAKKPNSAYTRLRKRRAMKTTTSAQSIAKT